jgi:hypothetical protein
VQQNAGAISFKTFYGGWYAGDCTTGDDCARAKSMLDAFQANGHTAAVSAPLQTPLPAGVTAVATLIGALAVALLAWRALSIVQSARVLVNPGSHTLTVERRRWILRTYRRTLAATDVRAATVRQEMRCGLVGTGGLLFFLRSKILQFTTTLELASGERLDVLDRWSPSREPHDRAAAQIGAYLAALAGAGPWPQRV